MTFEVFKVKVSFELKLPREIPKTVKKEKLSEGARFSITG